MFPVDVTLDNKIFLQNSNLRRALFLVNRSVVGFAPKGAKALAAKTVIGMPLDIFTA